MSANEFDYLTSGAKLHIAPGTRFALAQYAG